MRPRDPLPLPASSRPSSKKAKKLLCDDGLSYAFFKKGKKLLASFW